ncbi:DinB family protein [Nesterenkonia lutea]
MSSLDILRDIAQRPLDEARALRPALTPELVNAHPHHDNSIAWLLWHSAREIDEQIAALSGTEPAWTAQGFDARFSLGLEDHDMGLGHSGSQARQIHVEDTDLLLEHLRAAVQAQLTYLDSLDEADLTEVIDEQWDPPVTRSARLVSISLDAVAHVNQAAYITGMQSSAFSDEHPETA